MSPALAPPPPPALPVTPAQIAATLAYLRALIAKECP